MAKESYASQLITLADYFMSSFSAARCWKVDLEIVCAKLKALTDGVAIVSERLWRSAA